MVVGLSGMVVGVNVAVESDMVFGILRACTTVRTCIMTHALQFGNKSMVITLVTDKSMTSRIQ